MSSPPRSAAGARRPHPEPLFAALGNRTRLALVTSLAPGRARSIRELTGDSRLTRQAIAKHLRILERAGVVRATRRGRETRFRLDPEAIAAARGYLDVVAAQWQEALGRLKAFVEP
jgi:DNA-binding transcriptional ArsR family regulator